MLAAAAALSSDGQAPGYAEVAQPMVLLLVAREGVCPQLWSRSDPQVSGVVVVTQTGVSGMGGGGQSSRRRGQRPLAELHRGRGGSSLEMALLSLQVSLAP